MTLAENESPETTSGTIIILHLQQSFSDEKESLSFEGLMLCLSLVPFGNFFCVCLCSLGDMTTLNNIVKAIFGPKDSLCLFISRTRGETLVQTFIFPCRRGSARVPTQPFSSVKGKSMVTKTQRCSLPLLFTASNTLLEKASWSFKGGEKNQIISDQTVWKVCPTRG